MFLRNLWFSPLTTWDFVTKCVKFPQILEFNKMLHLPTYAASSESYKNEIYMYK